VLILIRHGQSTANLEGLLAGRLDTPLTNVGREQARALAPALRDVAVALTSPLRRARDTAALALPHVAASVDDAFIELDHGTEEGRPFAEFLTTQWRDFRNDPTFRVGGGESLADVDARVRPRLVALVAQYTELVADPGRHLAIVSHVSPIKSAVGWALGVAETVAWTTRLSNASLTTVTLRDGAPLLVCFNDTSVRREAPEPAT
jgi:broad specificity phosphatase PhoE